MTAELIAMLQRAGELVPRERTTILALGEADPDMLTLAQIADVTNSPMQGYGTAMSSLCARRFVQRVQPLPDERPVYRLLPRGEAAYREIGALRAHQARQRTAGVAA
jgi:DNA-binding MarR family transcriptional regulator